MNDATLTGEAKPLPLEVVEVDEDYASPEAAARMLANNRRLNGYWETPNKPRRRKMSQPTTAAVTCTVRAKAFSGQPIAAHRMLVDDANVRVWDPIAGYYTTCHALSRKTVQRIIRGVADGTIHSRG